ncbi:MAG: hypothetical protein NTU96_02065 [Actinobacteria bacterium]|nr:hypothetical protein [Actinomycetota bacterium]
MDRIKDLPPITAYPNHQNRRVMLTFMLAAMNDTGFVELSRRLVQVDLVRVGGIGVSRNLTLLCDDGWLYSDTPGRIGVGTIYEPGWRLRGDRELRVAWRAWANVLFGDGGIATPWKGTDALAYQSLGAHGLLVLAAIEQENGPVSRKALRKGLRPLLRSGSVDSRLDWLEIHDLLNMTSAEALEVHFEWRERLGTFFGENDVVAPRVKSATASERSANYLENGLSPELMRLKRNVRGKTCWKCGEAAVDLDHNPPQAWGGLDCEVMTRPSCKKCNGSVSILIRGNKPLPTKRIRIVIPEGQDVNEAAWAMYQARYDLIDQYFARKMVDRAKYSASMALSIHGAISGRGSGVYQQQTRVSDRGGSRLRQVRVEVDPDGKKYMRTKTSPRKRVGLGR